MTGFVPSDDDLSAKIQKVREKSRHFSASANETEKLHDLLERLHSTLLSQEASPPIRTIHHFACTGGTVISRFLASTPNACLLSEVDPLSSLAKHHFSPFDLALHYRNAQLKVNDQDQIDIFMAALEVIYDKVCSRRQRLILRDHAHSHFCTGARIQNRPTLQQIVAEKYPVLSVVTVRHPLDSYLSVVHNKFTHFTPNTLEEYAHRYIAFLDSYKHKKIVRYEDFVTDHDATMTELCDILRLPNSDFIRDVSSSIRLTGDSGRKGNNLRLRERRKVPEDIEEMRTNSKTYHVLCERLQYPL